MAVSPAVAVLRGWSSRISATPGNGQRGLAPFTPVGVLPWLVEQGPVPEPVAQITGRHGGRCAPAHWRPRPTERHPGRRP